ncbi:aldehyde dehydrogenase family protein [Stackebrandtia nassauensis]|uniref:Aldehyde dehydrogenase n=1 Tax=Stackebrandtia nassauensis (strain DSM 44728 / CIP 108903 / NRRL B-16338 / NBRC 102104 / LLR-40K-21) TaxID=446470 RepID=D3PWE9_STANL|nr:aldehyde dehydrogenase family protein [Stackebrandtia nassauensis]ADD41306.1 Aldehyde Dehydrogenase [Stackebrandtia nassauensis DSM 44728]
MSTAAPQISDGYLISTHPGNGSEVGRFAVDDAESVAKAVARARDAQTWWANLGFTQRRKLLLECRAEMARRIKDLVRLIRAETGKSVNDAFTEVAGCFENLAWAPKNARRVLGPRRRRGSLSMIDHSAYVEYRPYGVVAVIGPWNYPMYTVMGSVVYALAAGNTVVLKPSEYTPAVGQWLADVIDEVVGRPIVTVVHGLGETGAALCESEVDKIAFTGSVPTARKVAMAAAKRLIPVLIEGGGKDAAIVDVDADLDKTAEQLLWGAFTNAGQTCIGYERAYVPESIATELIDKLVKQATGIKVGDGEDAQIGPITMPRQIDVIAAHIDDALNRGATAVVGGREAVQPPYVHPTILVDVPEDSRAVTEETFGPVLVVNTVADAEEGLRRANATEYGLGGAVFGKRNAMSLARRMRSGMTSINSGFAFAGLPSLPFGGVGSSGYGRAHGDDGLREFAVVKSIAKRRAPGVIPVFSLNRKASHNKLIERIITFGSGKPRPRR